MRTPLREDIETIRKQLQIPESKFKPLPHTTNWQVLEEKIYHTFCKLDHLDHRPIWLWTAFKNAYETVSLDTDPYLSLYKLVDEKETVWFMVNESVAGKGEKFWFYEGKVAAIQTIIGETTYLDEMYLISKKYEWILCINHHHCLIGSGQPMVDRLIQFKHSQ